MPKHKATAACVGRATHQQFIDELAPRLAEIGRLATSRGASQSHINTVHKVMGYWEQRNIYSREIVRGAREGLPPADAGSQKEAPSDCRPTLKRDPSGRC